jgi:hypothetical protein
MLFVSGTTGTPLLAVGSNIVIPIGAQLGGLLNLAGVLSMILFFGLANVE